MDDANPPSAKVSTPEALADLLTQLRQSGLLGVLESAARQATTPAPPPTIGGDILYGADAIAEFLFGDKTFRRKVYNLVETCRLPHFRLGASICTRKSVLISWMAEQEKRTSSPSKRTR